MFIHGASGGVGTSLVKILLSMKKSMEAYKNIRIAASCSTEKAEAYLQQLDVDWVFNRTNPNYIEEVKRINDGKGPDVIYEMLANVNLNKDLVGAWEWCDG